MAELCPGLALASENFKLFIDDYSQTVHHIIGGELVRLVAGKSEPAIEGTVCAYPDGSTVYEPASKTDNDRQRRISLFVSDWRLIKIGETA